VHSITGTRSPTNVHHAPEQVGALIGRHRRKLAVGATDQDAVEAEADDPLDIPGQARMSRMLRQP
jgi:hypothetical protein